MISEAKSNDEKINAATDGVHRLPLSGISVVIVGAGIGGLTLAIEAWRQGHEVLVLERSNSLNVIGDTFGICPPGLVTVQYFPSLLRDFGGFSYDALASIYRHSGSKIKYIGEAEWNRSGNEHAARNIRVPWILSRFGLARALEEQARRLGIPIHYGKAVVKYSENEHCGTVETVTGDLFSADLVVAADGVGTTSHTLITGTKLPASSSGYAVFRGMIPIDCLKNISEDISRRFFSADRPEFRVYLAGDMHMNLIITSDFVNYVLTHKDSGNAAESWRSSVSASDVLQTMDTISGWDPALRAIISQTPDNSVVDWKLLWRDPQPVWCSRSGRVVQLGDSAHSFLPTSGNGATQAMEDAISLATSLRLGGKDRLANSVRAHVLMRFKRVSIVQLFGFANRQIFHTINIDEAEKNPVLDMKFSRWIYKHDPLQYAEERFESALQSVMENSPFVDTNTPPGYVYVPWTIQKELEREMKGLTSELRATGDWS